MAGQRVCIIGGDAAGMSAASRAKRRKPDLEIEVFEAGPFVSYGACGIPYFISGQVRQLEDLVVLRARDFQEKRGIPVHLHHRVGAIHPDRRIIEVVDQEEGSRREVSYDELVIATGAEPIVPPELDSSLPGVFVVRGLEEAARIKAHVAIQSPRHAVIVGAGYIGLEMAEALVEAGVKVTVVELAPRVIPAMEEEISAAAAEALAARGVEVITEERITAMEGEAGVLTLTLSGGGTVETALVIAAIGVTPRSALAREAGLALGVKGAIQVDRRQATSHPHIWAAGDCAESYHRLLVRNTYIPLALAANRQGRVVGDNLAGLDSTFPGVVGSAVSKVFHLTLARTGLSLQEARAEGIDAVKIEVTAPSHPHYYPGSRPIKTVVVAEKGTRRLWGVQMAGERGVDQRINVWATALTAGLTLPDIADLDLAYAPPYSPVWDAVLVASDVAAKKTR